MTAGDPPNLNRERRCWESGESVVVGVDEVGKGAWAGPLTIGAVVLPSAGRVNGIRDSKMLTPSAREGLFDRIGGWATSWSVGHASAQECDELGMSGAQRLATRRALDRLAVTPDRVLIDGNWNYIDWFPSTAIVKGDQTCLSIAAASIMAKVVRDQIMSKSAADFPAYIFEKNKGYPAPQHRMALAGYGPCVIHRKSWAFMDDLPWTDSRRYDRFRNGQGNLFAA
ncbi:MAG: ribonuclease HII [Actinomycetota bacterium]|nr:ribonuclease HII [Acidimicrobiales bacterium]MEC7873625.1 ribonuclease HII [Actinomycetota bacterium]MEC8976340.1 ribonuclease HII [Actinomycetota bacterium]|tara:strand:- start:1765 stop:2442 length:678 start_codon:yes stop_codon:yes gene_type:complete